MARRRGRGGGQGLNDEDRALWSQVARSVTPMSAADRRKAVSPAADVLPLPPVPHDHALVPLNRPAPVAPPADFRVGATAAGRIAASAARGTPASPAERLRAQPVQMDARTHRDLSRGKLRPEARIDLHGMTLAAAKAELTGFILSAQASGRRLVLVITGKGRGDIGPLPTRSGALRHEVPHWLHMAPMAGAVMQVVPAHFRHGGGGAYYVWLRRFRG